MEQSEKDASTLPESTKGGADESPSIDPPKKPRMNVLPVAAKPSKVKVETASAAKEQESPTSSDQQGTEKRTSLGYAQRFGVRMPFAPMPQNVARRAGGAVAPSESPTAGETAQPVADRVKKYGIQMPSVNAELLGKLRGRKQPDSDDEKEPEKPPQDVAVAAKPKAAVDVEFNTTDEMFGPSFARNSTASVAQPAENGADTQLTTGYTLPEAQIKVLDNRVLMDKPVGPRGRNLPSRVSTKRTQPAQPQPVDIDTIDGMEVSADGGNEPLVSPVGTPVNKELEKTEERNVPGSDFEIVEVKQDDPCPVAESGSTAVKVTSSGDDKEVEVSADMSTDDFPPQMHTQTFTSTTEEKWLAEDDDDKLFRKSTFERVEISSREELFVTETSTVSVKQVTGSTVTADDLFGFDFNTMKPISPPLVDNGTEERLSIEFEADKIVDAAIQQHSTVSSSFDPFHTDLQQQHSSLPSGGKTVQLEADRTGECLLSFGDEESVSAAAEQPIKPDTPERGSLLFEETGTPEFRNVPTKEAKRDSSLLYFDEPEAVESSVSNCFLLELSEEPKSEGSLLDFSDDRTAATQPAKLDLFDKDVTARPGSEDKFDSGFLIVDKNKIAELPTEPEVDVKFGGDLFSSIEKKDTLEFSAEESKPDEHDSEPFVFEKNEASQLSTEAPMAADNSKDGLELFDRPTTVQMEFSAEPAKENKFDDGNLLFEFKKHETVELPVQLSQQENKFDDDFSFFDRKTSPESKPEPMINDKRGSSLLDFDDVEIVQQSVSVKLSAEPVGQQEVRLDPLLSEADKFPDVSPEPVKFEQPENDVLLDFGYDRKTAGQDDSAAAEQSTEVDRYGIGSFEMGATKVSDRPAGHDKRKHVDFVWNDHDEETRFTSESSIELKPGADLFQSTTEDGLTVSARNVPWKHSVENGTSATISFLPEQDLIVVSTETTEPCGDSMQKEEKKENFGVSMATASQQSEGHDKDSKFHISETAPVKQTGELSPDKKSSVVVTAFPKHVEKHSTEEKPAIIISTTFQTTTEELFTDEKPTITMSTFPEHSRESFSEKKPTVIETTIKSVELSPEEKPSITVSTFPKLSEEHSADKKPTVIETTKQTVELSPEKKTNTATEEVTPEKKPSITMSTFPKQTQETSRNSPTFEQAEIHPPEEKPSISMDTFPKQSTDSNTVPHIKPEETVLTLERSLSKEEWRIYSAVPYKATHVEKEKDSAAKTSEKRLSTASKEAGPVATETTEKRVPVAKNIMNYEISPVHAVSETRTSWRDKLKEKHDEEQKFDASPSKTWKDFPEPEVKGASVSSSTPDRSPTNEPRITVATSVTLERSKETKKDSSKPAEVAKSAEVAESRKSAVEVTKSTNGAGTDNTRAIDTPQGKLQSGRISGTTTTTTTSTTRTVTETYSSPLFPKTKVTTTTPSESKRSDMKVPLSVKTKELSPNPTPETRRINVRTSAALSPTDRSLSKTPSTDSDSPKTPEAWSSVLNRRSMTPAVVKPAGAGAPSSNTNLYLDIRSRLKHVQKPMPVVPVVATDDTEPAANPLYNVKRRGCVPDPLLLSPKSPAAESDSPPPFLVEWQRRKSCASPGGIRPAGNSRTLSTAEQSEPEFKRKAAMLTAKHRQHSQSIEA